MTDIKQVTVLVDNDSWILPYAQLLCDELLSRNIKVNFARDQMDIVNGCLCFILGCTQIVTPHNLAKNRNNLVVHESDLPMGKGFSPMAWQILEGKKVIPICIFEADHKVDSGVVWLRSSIILKGNELCAEWRNLQGQKTVELCIKCVEEYKSIKPEPQSKGESFYSRRTAKDSELSIHKSLAEQFNLLRTVDNERYPAYFKLNGDTFVLNIKSKKTEEG